MSYDNRKSGHAAWTSASQQKKRDAQYGDASFSPSAPEQPASGIIPPDPADVRRRRIQKFRWHITLIVCALIGGLYIEEIDSFEEFTGTISSAHELLPFFIVFIFSYCCCLVVAALLDVFGRLLGFGMKGSKRGEMNAAHLQAKQRGPDAYDRTYRFQAVPRPLRRWWR